MTNTSDPVLNEGTTNGTNNPSAGIAQGGADRSADSDMTRDDLKGMLDQFKKDIRREAAIELQHFKAEYIRETTKTLTDQLGPKIGPIFVPIVDEIKDKVHAGKFVNYDNVAALYENKIDDVSHLVFDEGQTKVMPGPAKSKKIDNIKTWLEVHSSIMKVMIDRGNPSSDVASMLHHQIVVIQRNSMFPWGAVYDYEQRKRKAVEEHGGNYSVLEWHLPEEETRLQQLLFRQAQAQSSKSHKRVAVDLTPDAEGKRRCLDYWTGKKVCNRSNCKFSHKPAKSDYAVSVIECGRQRRNESMDRKDVLENAEEPHILGNQVSDRTEQEGYEPEFPYHAHEILEFPPDSQRRLMITEIFSIRPQLKHGAWLAALAQHPDRTAVAQFLHEIENGTNIRYEGPTNATHEWDSPLKDGPGKQRFLATLRKEHVRGHFIGPLRQEEIPFKHYIACPVYGVPKNDQYDRLIHDLTAKGSAHAINSHIDPNQFNIKLPRLRDTMQLVLNLKEQYGTVYLWSEDVSEAFHHVKLDLPSRPLLMFKIGERYYVRTTISFGSRSSPGLWYEVTELFLWTLRHQYPDAFTRLQCYVDDFLGMGHDRITECRNQLRFQVAAKQLGISLDSKKKTLPATRILSLGFLIDTEQMKVSVPHEKMNKAKQRIRDILDSDHIGVKDLQRIVGTLNHLAQIMPAGRTFMFSLRRSLATGVSNYRKIPTGITEDLAVWLQFMDEWNASYDIIQERDISFEDINLYTDASDWGMGGWNGELHAWFSIPWTKEQQDLHIGAREMMATKKALELWGHEWAGRTMIMHTDNQGNVDAMTNRRSRKDAALAELLREIFYLELRHRCRIILQHVPGLENEIADALSRNEMQRFHRLWSGTCHL
jgi:hypothetical protein